MGGTALTIKNVTTRRYLADEYEAIGAIVLSVLENLGGAALVGYEQSIIKSYKSKPSFGDLDVLLNYYLSNDAIQYLFKPTAIVRNGDVVSFDYMNFQIDFITVRPNEYDFALNYFAFNDLGNLVGRVANKMGFKFGHDGLWYEVKNPNCYTHVIEKLLVTDDFNSALSFLGFNPYIFNKGFSTLDEIFDYVYTSTYFNPDIFLLENRSNKARVRDLKRPTYMAFLNYVKSANLTGSFIYPDDSVVWVYWAEAKFPEFAELRKNALLKYIDNLVFKEKFNGELVALITGLEFQQLGLFMAYLKNEKSLYQLGTELSKPVVISWTQEAINHAIELEYTNYKRELLHERYIS